MGIRWALFLQPKIDVAMIVQLPIIANYDQNDERLNNMAT